MSTAGYCPNTPADIREMLAAIGAGTIEELFSPIPAPLRARSFDLPEGMSEFELLTRMKELAGANSAGLTHFIGGGFYDHYIPAVVDHLPGGPNFPRLIPLTSPNVHRGHCRRSSSTRRLSAG